MRPVLLTVMLAGCGLSTSDNPGNLDDPDGTRNATPSCRPVGPGSTNCGPSRAESCCVSLQVPGGTYYRTYTNTGAGPLEPADPATVSGFRLDKYLVTVGRFRQYVNYLENGGPAPDPESGKHTHLNGGLGLIDGGDPASAAYETGWDAGSWNQHIATGPGAAATWDKKLTTDGAAYANWTTSPGTNESLPINGVSWYAAYGFCIWDGGFLPSEAEWGYAAAGGSQQREYPWGPTSPGTDNQYAIFGDGLGGDCYFPGPGLQRCRGNAGSTSSVANAAPVGSTAKGAGLWGQFDLAGNEQQWTLDGYAGYGDPCQDCAYLSPAPYRVLRGSAYFAPLVDLPVWLRRGNVGPEEPRRSVGIRCARTP